MRGLAVGSTLHASSLLRVGGDGGLDWVGARKLPYLTRASFVAEFRHLAAWNLLAGLVEGHFASVVVAKSFHGGPFLIAVAAATPMVANLSSLGWGMLCYGRAKIPLMMTFAAGVVTCVAAVGMIPPGSSGAIPFIATMGMAQIMLVGVVTVRTSVWKANYPATHRGQITARLQRLRVAMSVVTVLVAAEACDRDPTAYRILFPLTAVIGCVGIFLARRIRIRGEHGELRRQRLGSEHGGTGASSPAPRTVAALLWPGRVVTQMARVLMTDRRYALYCLAQFLLGFGNIMTIAVVVLLIARELPLDEASGYWVGTVLVVAIPNLLVLLSVTRWGTLFDRLGVLRMRVVNVACWLVSLIFGCAAAVVIVHSERIGAAFLPIAVGLLGFRAIGFGLGLGGGALAWNLGHLHFAKPEQAEVYMGVHVSLTGVRGLTAPLLGIWLWHVIGWPVWLIAIVLTLLSEAAFVTLVRLEARDKAARGA